MVTHFWGQGLKDAIAFRDLWFCSLPGMEVASFRVFRQPDEGEPELIISGLVMREQKDPGNVPLLAIRAK